MEGEGREGKEKEGKGREGKGEERKGRGGRESRSPNFEKLPARLQRTTFSGTQSFRQPDNA